MTTVNFDLINLVKIVKTLIEVIVQKIIIIGFVLLVIMILKNYFNGKYKNK